METRKIDQFVVEKKIKSFHKYCPTAIATTFNSQFVVDAEMQKSIFWNISNLGLYCNSVALNINFKSYWVFRNTKLQIN